jgi:hypothetical protein
MAARAAAPDRRPHLVRWFVIATALCLLLAGGGILVVVERTLTRQGERHAVDQARSATHALLDRRLRASDLTSSLQAARRRRLAALFSRASLGSDSTGATLYAKGGVIFTTGTREATASALARARLALKGRVISDVTSTTSGRRLRAFLPVALRDGRARGVVEIDQDYAPIAAALIAADRRTAGRTARAPVRLARADTGADGGQGEQPGRRDRHSRARR